MTSSLPIWSNLSYCTGDEAKRGTAKSFPNAAIEIVHFPGRYPVKISLNRCFIIDVHWFSRSTIPMNEDVGAVHHGSWCYLVLFLGLNPNRFRSSPKAGSFCAPPLWLQERLSPHGGRLKRRGLTESRTKVLCERSRVDLMDDVARANEYSISSTTMWMNVTWMRRRLDLFVLCIQGRLSI